MAELHKKTFTFTISHIQLYLHIKKTSLRNSSWNVIKLKSLNNATVIIHSTVYTLELSNRFRVI